MKRFLLIVLLLSATYSSTAQVYWDEEKYAGVNISYTRENLNIGSYDLAGIELTLYPSKSMGWEFSTKLNYGADYLSFEPVGLLGTLMVVYTQTHKKQFGGSEKLLSALLAISSAKLPIYPFDYVEFTPYWSLFKLTKLGDASIKVCGHIGLALKIFPFCHSLKWNTFYIAPYVQHDFGYKKTDKEYLPYWFDGDSPFAGTSFGFQTGFYFW